jgi:quercetin dioxygenase-like cupin family protein
VAHAGQEITSPSGFRLRLIVTAAESDGELLAMEGIWTGAGGFPQMHLHPSQDERFEVLEGELRSIVDGEERRYRPGDIFGVPAGTPHTMTADVPTRSRWEVRPALRTAEFFERLYSGEVTDFEAFVEEFSAEFQLPPG